jgi:uncharacterized membrane protein YcaP (DUF421 family)
MDVHELSMTALRAVAVYFVMLLVIRVSGKRAIGNFTAFDLLVALMLGEVVDEIIYGDVTMAQGLVAIGVVTALQYMNSWLSYYDHGMDRILEGKPTIVVRDGALARSGMRAERMNEKDVMAELRLRGIDDVREVKLAVVEVGGDLSVIRHRWAEPLQKADLDEREESRKYDDTDGEEEPPESMQTDSPRALGHGA